MAAKLLKGADSSYWASPGMAWSGAQAMDGPRRGPHGAQRAVMARSVARAEAIDD
jgi:hypothetical protein